MNTIRALGRTLFTMAAAAAALLLPAFADACSTFVLKNEGGLVFGQNYDWDIGHGMVVMNPRHAVKQGVSLTNPSQAPLVWEAKHASVSFNQYGIEFPTSGMNEKGVVVALMWLNETKYPAPDERPELLCLQWIQRALDTCDSIDQVVDQALNIRISTDSPPLHFLVSDAKGDSAVIEFLDGKVVIRYREDLPFCALTNDTYASSVRFARQFAPFGGPTAVPDNPGTGSLARFALAAKGSNDAASVPPTELPTRALTILDDIAQPGYTKWSIVFEPRNQRVHWHTSTTGDLRTLEVSELYVDCDKPRLCADIDAPPTETGAPAMAPFTVPANRELIGKSFAGTDFVKDTPAQVLDLLAGLPAALGCDGGTVK